MIQKAGPELSGPALCFYMAASTAAQRGQSSVSGSTFGLRFQQRLHLGLEIMFFNRAVGLHAVGGEGQLDGSVQAFAHPLFRTGVFQRLVHIGAQRLHLCPLGIFRLGEIPGRVHLGHLVEQDAFSVVLLAVGHGGPDLFGGKGQNRGDEADHAAEDVVHGGLSRTALQRVGAVAVQSVLDDIQIEVGHLHHAEVVDGAVDIVELVGLIAGAGIFDQGVKLRQRPAVQL